MTSEFDERLNSQYSHKSPAVVKANNAHCLPRVLRSKRNKHPVKPDISPLIRFTMLKIKMKIAYCAMKK